MLIDVWKQFSGLIPSQTTIVATVVALNGDGTSNVQTPEGGIARVIGGTVGVQGRVYVQAGRIVGAAPDLPPYNLEV